MTNFVVTNIRDSMKFLVRLLLILCVAPLCMAGDGVPFNGMIVDVNGKGIKRARVYVTSADRYSTTDGKGRFGLTDVAPGDTLKIRLRKGKTTYYVPVDSCQGIRICLADEGVVTADPDEELVAYGYGFVKRREFTGVSNGISGDELRRTGRPTILAALSGRIPGLVVSGTNAPGSSGSATIRGQHTISSHTSTTPLYIVDGVEVDNLDSVSIYDVDHVEIVKDASIYGTRGANGAILVFTKSGPGRN